MNKKFDVLVIGAGPAGLAAAKCAADAGAKVGIVDDNPAPGGQIWRGSLSERRDSMGNRLWNALRNASNVQIFQQTRVICPQGGSAVMVETPDSALLLEFDRLILATGARELFLPFPGWTLPGVVGAGGLQALVKGGYPVAGKRIVVAGTGPLLLAVAATLKNRGATVCVIAEQAPAMAMVRFSASLLAFPKKLLQALQLRLKVHRTRYSMNSFVLEARGTDRLQTVSIKAGKRSRLIECDYLACGYGLVPNLELPSTFGCRIDDGKVLVDSYQRSSISNIFCAGEITGIAGVDSAIVQGSIAGLAAVGKSAQADLLIPKRERWCDFSHRLSGAFALRPELSKTCKDDTIVCRCEDVSHGELKQYSTWRSAKLQTRCGMGPCQGRICGPATTSLYGWVPGSLRPPLVPARLSSLIAQESRN